MAVSARDGNLKYVHVAWIPAVHVGTTGFETLVYNDESSSFTKLEAGASKAEVPNLELGDWS